MIVDRILQYISYKGINKSKFYAKTGLSNGFLDKVKDVGVSKIEKILSSYGDINPIWLICGDGDMIIDKDLDPGLIKDGKPVPHGDFMHTPVVINYAKAGYLAGYGDQEFIDSLPKILLPKEYEKGNYLVFEIEGDSMNDQLQEGDKVLAKELPKEYWSSKLQINKYLFIIVSRDGIVIKQITKHDVATGKIRCHSLNNSPEYSDFTMSLNTVYKLFYIKKIIDKKVNF